jgi:hypothetical protein
LGQHFAFAFALSIGQLRFVFSTLNISEFGYDGYEAYFVPFVCSSLLLLYKQ